MDELNTTPDAEETLREALLPSSGDAPSSEKRREIEKRFIKDQEEALRRGMPALGAPVPQPQVPGLMVPRAPRITVRSVTGAAMQRLKGRRR